MSRPRQSLAHRVAKYTGIDADLIQYTLDNHAPSPGEGLCWPWMGHCFRQSPIMKHEGKPQPVRRVLWIASTGEELPAEARIQSGCTGMFCVNPNHSFVKTLSFGPPVWPGANEPSIEDDDDPIEDVVATVYDQPEPWDAQEISERTGYNVRKVASAIDGIKSGQW